MSSADISNFCEITGGTSEIAERYLQIADNNLDTAISLYLESEGDLVTGSQQQGSSHSSRPVSIHSEDDHMLTDEELARQLQDEADQVRAPIAPRTEILTGPQMFHHSPSSWQREQIRPSIFNQGDSATGSVTDFLSRLQSTPSPVSESSTTPTSSSPAAAKAKRLADLFRPPFDIMFHGNFEEAREIAKEKSKWLMINIQNQTEFACQVMNRDLWSDSFVKDIVKESFVFLQYTNESVDGKRYATFYTVSGYPHLAVIDARTGERIKMWEKQLSPTDFMMDITEFLENGEKVKRPRTKKNVSDMSEEEQLNAAIEASLGGSTQSKELIVAEDDDGVEEVEAIEEEQEEVKAGSALDAIKAVKRDETTDIPNSTRIQLRLADGSRIVRRFNKQDPVKYIFEFVKSEVPNAESQAFELVFNRTQLIDVLDETIESAGLSNAAVNCVFV